MHFLVTFAKLNNYFYNWLKLKLNQSAHRALAANVDTDPCENPYIPASGSTLINHDSQTVRRKVLAVSICFVYSCL